MASDPCPTCGKPYSKRLRRQHAGLPPLPTGRPRGIDYEKIRALRKRGMSLTKIAEKMKCSRGVVQHALRSE